MELPTKFKQLYRHWDRHAIDAPANNLTDVIADERLAGGLSFFIRERMTIWQKKYLEAPPPYTDDVILREFRFCNVLRELDRQTVEYHTLLNPLRDRFPLWLLNMFYARMVARPATLEAVGLLSFDEDTNEQLLERLQALPKPRYGTPYVFPVSTIMRGSTPTRELFIARYLPQVMLNIATEIATWHRQSVSDGVTAILPRFGVNLAFLWTEVLIDVAYQYPERIDLFAEFPIGPGAAPTFARIGGDNPSRAAQTLGRLNIPSGLTYDGMPIVLSAENWEGIGCEFRKYTNLSTGKGRRRRYVS